MKCNDWRLAGALVFCLAVSLLLCEALVRQCVLSPANIVFDAELGPMKAPHSAVLRTYEGYARFTTDAFGFNNDALPANLPEHRLLVLGDSFVEATHVMREKNFVSLLNQREGRFAYNAGFAGADPRVFPELARRFQQVLGPDLLVLCVNEGDLSAMSTVELPPYPPPSGLKQWLQPLFAHSALATHLNWKYKSEIVAWWKHLRHEAEKEPDTAEVHAVPTAHLANWRNVLEQVRQINPHVLVVVLPSLTYGQQGAVAFASPASDAMRGAAEQLGIPVVQTTEAFINDYKTSGLPALGFSNTRPGHGHLNSMGHRIVAGVISAYLEEGGL